MPFEDLIGRGIRGKLSALKRALRAHLLGRGLSLAIVAMVAGVFFSYVIDRMLDMERAQRALILAVALAGIGYVLWRFLIRPLRVPMDAEELALVLEDHYGELDDRLISTLQFARVDAAATGVSEALIGRVADQANQLADGLDATAPLQRSGTWKRLGMAAAAVAVLAAFSVAQAQNMHLWFQRNILFMNVAYPRDTYLTVVGGPEFHVIRGRNLDVTVTADPAHVVPDHVVFHMKFSVGDTHEAVNPAEPDGHVFVKTFEAVTETFTFTVTGHDDETDECRVTVVDPPELIEARFTIDYPDYIGAKDVPVKAEHGVLVAPPGSVIALTGRANKDLAAGTRPDGTPCARLLLDGKAVGSLRVVRVPDAPDGRPVGVRGAFRLPERVKRRSMALHVELTDTSGIVNDRGAVYAVRVDPDRAPTISLTRIGVRSDVTARAIVPVLLNATDDRGVDSLAVALKPIVVEPPALTTRPASAPAAATTQPVEHVVAVPGVPAKQTDLRMEFRMDLRALQADKKIADLSVGYLLRVQAIARDGLPESFGGPNVTRGLIHTYRIVSEEMLMEELLRRRRELRLEFHQSVVLQAEVRDRVASVHDRLSAANARIDAEIVRRMLTGGEDQRRIAARCDTVARQLREILDEMELNRVGEERGKQALAKTIGNLEKICGKPMKDVADALVRASKGKDVGALRDSAKEFADVLDGFYEQLNEILEGMIRDLNREEFSNLLRRIIEWSRKLQQQIDEEQKAKTKELFER